MYISTACATPHWHEIDQIYAQEPNCSNRKIIPRIFNYFELQKTDVKQNQAIKIPNELEISCSMQTELQKMLKEDFNKIDREIERELLEKDRIDQMNSILFYNPYRSAYHDRLKAIIRDNEKATVYHDEK